MPRKVIATVTNDLNQDQRMHRICNALVDLGYDVLLVGRVKQNSKVLLSQKFQQYRIRCFFFSGVLFYLEYNIRLYFMLFRNKHDITWSVDLDTLLAGSLARLGHNKRRLIHDAHEFFVEVPELQSSKLKKMVWDWVGKKYVSSCDLCVTVNNELAFILSQRYKNKFHVLRNTPYLQEENEKIKRKDYILYQGVLNAGRGLEEAITAICSLEERVELHLAGEGDLSSKLRQLKKDIDQDDRIKFLGWLDPDELQRVTKQAKVGLNLLISESLNYKYSLANKFFDYMHAEVPSINMKFPVYQRICEEYEVGLCIANLKSETITSAVKRLCMHHVDYSRMQENCKRAKKSYNWQTEKGELKKYMNKLEDEKE